ncbi:MAG: MFS transporter [Clostridiales bacterium]|nr:MFS transporter [Clostridiales bacterium]
MLRRLHSYKHTVAASCIGYITQAIVNNFLPLLFVMFNVQYGISLEKLALLVSVNFGTQLLVDLLSAKFVDKIGYRPCVVAAHALAATGLILLGILPDVMPNAFAGVVIADVVCALGSGLCEVVVSPIVEACPSEKKSANMSVLHSFYCWGVVVVVLLSTLLLRFAGMRHWRYIAMGWAILPLVNILYLSVVPMAKLTEESEGMKVGQLCKSKIFWVFVLLMLCAGAIELAVAQWASAFAERSLGVGKTVGDVAGPCMFAVCMGAARLLHAKIGEKTGATLYLTLCGFGCLGGYLLASLVPNATVSLIGCGIIGFSVGALWPALYSLSAKKCPSGGTAMFALLALAGDCGCMVGPSLVGVVSGAFGDNLGKGLLFATVFPAVFLVGLLLLKIVCKPCDNAEPLPQDPPSDT